MVVVGAENVVRRMLVPDIADVAAQRLEAANERVRIATVDAAQKSAAAVTTKADVDSIDEEKLAAQTATKDAEALEAVRADTFAANADALAARANAEATVVAKSDALAAAKARSDRDRGFFTLAKAELATAEKDIRSVFEKLNSEKSKFDRSKQQVFEIKEKLKYSAKSSPIEIKNLEAELANAQENMDGQASRVKFLRSIEPDLNRSRNEAREIYDTARFAADKANFTVNSAGEDLREAQANLAIAQEAAKRAEATLSDADDKATAAQDVSKELNAPDAIRKRNEPYAKALADATVASNIANAAQEAATLARDTAKQLAAAASSAPLPQDQKTDIQQAITRGGAVAGAIGIAILVLQIFVNSMRYYARLAEFYDAQADALLASGNNPALASEFLEKFSPALINFGKTPLSIYEKALDTVGKVAGRAARRGEI